MRSGRNALPSEKDKRLASRGVERFSQVIESVTHDHRLTMGACVTFTELVLWTEKGKGVVSRGQRSLAAAIGVHRQTLAGYLSELMEYGYIEIGGTGHQRRWYILTNDLYWGRVKSDDKENRAVETRASKEVVAPSMRGRIKRQA